MQQVLNEETLTFCPRDRRFFADRIPVIRLSPFRQRQRAVQFAHHAVERHTFLRPAGEVDPARGELGFEVGAGEDRAQVVRQQRTQRGELLREEIRFGAGFRVMLFQHGFRQPGIKALLEQGKLLLEVAHQVVIGVFGLLPRQRKAPDLVALRFVVVGKPGAEALKQVGLGHHHVHREADTQLFMQLGQTLAQVHRLLAGRLGGLGEQVRNADGDDDAVDRLAAAILAQ